MRVSRTVEISLERERCWDLGVPSRYAVIDEIRAILNDLASEVCPRPPPKGWRKIRTKVFR